MDRDGTQQRAATSGIKAVEIVISGPVGASYADWQFRSRPVRARCLPSLALGDPLILLQHIAAPVMFFDIMTGTPSEPRYRQRLPDASRIEVFEKGHAPVWVPASPGRMRVLRIVVPDPSGSGALFRAYHFDPRVPGNSLQVVTQQTLAM